MVTTVVNLRASSVICIQFPKRTHGRGLLLCKSKDQTVAEYALRDINKPLGIAEFRTQDLLPDTLKGTLPTIADLEAGLADASE